MCDTNEDKHNIAVANDECKEKESKVLLNHARLLAPFENLVQESDVRMIIESQRNMMTRFEKSNEMLVNCNALAMMRFEHSSRDLKRYTSQLSDMKRDLDSVFRRIRFLRIKLTQQYPDAFKACSSVFNVLDEEEENQEEDKNEKAKHQIG